MKLSLKQIILAVLALSFTAVSCDSFFDINTKDQATLPEIMSRSTSVRQFLAHLYSYIPEDENLRANEGGTSLRSDEALHAKSQYETSWYSVRRGEYSSASTKDVASGNYWKKYYEAINECASFIDNLHYDQEDSRKLVECMEGEARFLRAYFYFCLFRHYGPVYLWKDADGNAVAADQNIHAESIDRHTVDENVQFIVKELDKAAELLPATISEVVSSSANMGRATKGAALALKTRLLLYAASPLYNGQNGSPIYANFTNHRGEKLFPAYDASKWDAVYEAGKAVLELNQYELNKTGNPLTSMQDAADSYQGIWFNNWKSKETIFGWWYRQWAEYQGSIGGEIAFSAPSGGQLCSIGYSLITPSLKQIDAYPMAESGRYPVVGYYETNGMLDYSRPIVDDKSGYKATGWKENYQQIVDVDPAWATPIKVHNSTVGRDARFYSCWVPNGFWWPCQRPMDKDTPLRFTCYNNKAECTSPYSVNEGCNRVGYCWRRLYKAGNTLKENSDYTSIQYVFPVFRLAEVYLTLAEACNERTNRNAAEAIGYIDLVRARSGLKGLAEAYPEIDFNGAGGTIGGITRSGQEWLRWMILREKMCEFVFEGSMRHYDAMRTMTALKEYNVENWTLHVTADNYEDSYDYRVSTDYIGGRSLFREKDYLFPFGSTQLAEMTHLTQNPGW